MSSHQRCSTLCTTFLSLHFINRIIHCGQRTIAANDIWIQFWVTAFVIHYTWCRENFYCIHLIEFNWDKKIILRTKIPEIWRNSGMNCHVAKMAYSRISMKVKGSILIQKMFKPWTGKWTDNLLLVIKQSRSYSWTKL